MSELWTNAAAQVAAEARGLRPFALAVAGIATLWLLADGVGDPLVRAGQTPSQDWPAALEAIGRYLAQAGPALALVWGLWEAAGYLDSLAKGVLWGPATARLLKDIGTTLLAAAAMGLLVSPTILAWLDRPGGFQFREDPAFAALGGLGLILVLSGGAVGRAFAVAAALKDEADQIV